MTKFLSALVAAVFAVVSLTPAFAQNPKADEGKATAAEKKADKKKSEGKKSDETNPKKVK